MDDGILETSGDRSRLRFERRLRHPVERVWRSITEPAELAHWFPGPVELEPVAGTKINFGGEPGAARQGEVVEVDPPRRFVITWNDTVLSFDLAPDGGGTRLVFTQTFDDRPFAACFAAGWESCLGAEEAALAGTPRSNEPPDYPRRHEQYAAAFHLSDGTITSDGSAFQVALDRLLPWPEATVRAALPDWPVTDAGPGGTRLCRIETAQDLSAAAVLLAGWQHEIAAAAAGLAAR